MSGTPGEVCRRRAINGDTLEGGNWPPSPGFEPCAILISSSSARTRYSAVTPKRAEATCLILLLTGEPSSVSWYQAGSSPPSPVLLRAPILFIAAAIVRCV